MFKKFINTITFFGFMVVSPTISFANNEVTLTYVNEYGNTFQGIYDEYFIDRVESMSNGNINIQYYTEGSLGIVNSEQFNAVNNNVVDIASSYTGQFSGHDDLFKSGSTPFLIPDNLLYSDERKTFRDVFVNHVEHIFSQNNQRILYSTSWQSGGIWTNVNIEELNDFQSLNIRVIDNISERLLTNIGANALNITFSEVFHAIETGQLNAVLTPIDLGFSINLQEQFNYYYKFNFDSAVQIIHINEDVYQSLTENQKSIIRTAASETERYATNQLNEIIRNDRNSIRDNEQVEYRELDSELFDEIKTIGDRIINDMRNNIDGFDELLNEYNSRVNN